MECLTANNSNMRKHVKKCLSDLFKTEQFNFFDISPFRVLHHVNYNAFIRL